MSELNRFRGFLKMGDSIKDYTFTIIEDGAVPLAGNFDQVAKMPIATIVIIGLIVLAVCSYAVWCYSKLARVKEYSELTLFQATVKYFLHPQRLVEVCEECEHNALSGNVI